MTARRAPGRAATRASSAERSCGRRRPSSPRGSALGLRAKVRRGGRAPARADACLAGCRADAVATTLAAVRVRAGAAVLAVNSATAGFAGFRLAHAVASSHMVITEPVPDVIEETRLDRRRADRGRPHASPLPPHDARRPDRVRLGRRPDGLRCAPARPARRRPGRGAHGPRRPAPLLPAARAAGGSRMPGAARSTSPPPTCRSSAAAAASTTASASPGTASGPSYLGGEILARLALDRRDELTRLALVDPDRKLMPPEPLRWAGGSADPPALVRADRAEDAGRRPDPAHALRRGPTAPPRAPPAARDRRSERPSRARFRPRHVLAERRRTRAVGRARRRRRRAPGRAPASARRSAWVAAISSISATYRHAFADARAERRAGPLADRPGPSRPGRRARARRRRAHGRCGAPGRAARRGPCRPTRCTS